MKIEFTIPWPTPSLNQWQRMHWSKRQTAKKSYALGVLIKVGRHNTTVPVSVVITRYSSGKLDHDNLVGGCKGLVDAMVHVGLAVDDSPEWITVEYKQEKCTRKKARTEVVIDG